MKNAAIGSKWQFLLGVAEIFISQNVSKWLLKRLANQKSDTERSKLFNHIFSNIALSLLKELEKYVHLLLTIFLMLEDYVFSWVKETMRNVEKYRKHWQKTTLPYKNVNNNFLNNNSFFIFLTFNYNFNYLRSCLYSYFSLISNKYISLKNKKLVVINNIKTNIGSLLIVS